MRLMKVNFNDVIDQLDKIQNDEKSVRESMLSEICEALQATAVHHIGLQIIVYRAASEPKIVLPK